MAQGRATPFPYGTFPVFFRISSSSACSSALTAASSFSSICALEALSRFRCSTASRFESSPCIFLASSGEAFIDDSISDIRCGEKLTVLDGWIGAIGGLEGVTGLVEGVFRSGAAAGSGVLQLPGLGGRFIEAVWPAPAPSSPTCCAWPSWLVSEFICGRANAVFALEIGSIGPLPLLVSSASNSAA